MQTLNRYPIVVMNFYAPWCHWCQRLEPAWEAATKEVHEKYPEGTDGRIRFAKVRLSLQLPGQRMPAFAASSHTCFLAAASVHDDCLEATAIAPAPAAASAVVVEAHIRFGCSTHTSGWL